MEFTLNFIIIILSFIPGYYLGVFRFKIRLTIIAFFTGPCRYFVLLDHL